MMRIRKATERGHADHGWIDTYHTFSFADYYDRNQMGFRALRVINEDRVQPGMGFPTHPHRDMEIISYVLEGALAHRDSMGNGSVIRPGDVQRMSAGTGITHSEYNDSDAEPVHFLQIWILPATNGMTPSYQQKAFTTQEERGILRLVASPDGREGSVCLHQDVNLFTAILAPGEDLIHRIPAGRHVWLQMARGKALVNGNTLEQSDGAAISDEDLILIAAQEKTEILLFDLA